MTIPMLTSALPARHGFFTRKGGVSAGAYDSLNCSFSSDDPAHVRENRARVMATLGGGTLLGLKQVHGPEVVTVRAAWAEGEGPRADAMVTDMPGLALGVITADCAPVLFCSADGRVIGAAHAGWKGAVSGVLEATIEAMRALGGTGIKAAIGPCIKPASYEVGADMRDALLAASLWGESFFAPGRPGHWQFDLPGYAAARLRAVDVGAEILPQDTCAEEQKFFSHRRRTLRGESALGHQISVIRL